MTHIQKKTQTIMLREAGQHQGSVSHLVLFVLVFTVRSDLRISHMIICLLLNTNGNMTNQDIKVCSITTVILYVLYAANVSGKICVKRELHLQVLIKSIIQT